MLTRRHTARGHYHAQGINKRSNNDSFAITNLFRNRSKYRLPNTPRQILNRNRQGKLAAQPIKLFSDWNLENTKGRTYCETDHDDQTAHQ